MVSHRAARTLNSVRSTRDHRFDVGLLRPAFESLVEAAKLQEDWDSYGALPPTALGIATAGHVIVSVAERFGDSLGELVAPYAVMPFPNGGVQIVWRRSLSEIQVDVGPKGDLGYLRIEREGGNRQASEAETASFGEILTLIEQTLR